MKNRGSILILFLPATLALMTLIFFLSRWGHALWRVEKARAIAEATLVSTLRIKVEGLQSLAEKWNELEPFLGAASPDGVVVPSANWKKVIDISQNLKKSLPGYKGRIKSVIKVVAEANGVTREDVQIVDERAFEMDVLSQGQWIIDPSGLKTWAEGLWLSRTWDLQHPLGHPSIKASHEVVLDDPLFGILRAQASGRLEWDVSSNHPSIRIRGNGGYPRNWNDALEGSLLNPFRFPFFRVEVLSEREPSHAT